MRAIGAWCCGVGGAVHAAAGQRDAKPHRRQRQRQQRGLEHSAAGSLLPPALVQPTVMRLACSSFFISRLGTAGGWEGRDAERPAFSVRRASGRRAVLRAWAGATPARASLGTCRRTGQGEGVQGSLARRRAWSGSRCPWDAQARECGGQRRRRGGAPPAHHPAPALHFRSGP